MSQAAAHMADKGVCQINKLIRTTPAMTKKGIASIVVLLLVVKIFCAIIVMGISAVRQ